MKAVVMAGGEGSRLRPLTSQLPKPLLGVAGRPVMEHIVNLLRRHGITEIIATLHYLADEIEGYFGDGSSFGVRMHYVVEDRPLGTAGAVKQAHHLLHDETFLIISGDALTDMNLSELIASHRERRADVTIALQRVSAPLEFGVVVTDEEDRITRFLEKPSWGEVFSDTINTGIYVLEPTVLDIMEPGRNYDFSRDVFPQLQREQKRLFGHVSNAYWADIGTHDQYQQTCFDALSGKIELSIPGECIRPGIYVGPGSRIDPSAVLEPPIVIGSHVRIGANAYIEGPTVLGNSSIIESEARLVRTIAWNDVYVGKEAKLDACIVADRNTIKARATIGDSAILGRGCTIGVGATVRPNLRLWPGKYVASGSILSMSLIYGKKWPGSLFGTSGVSGLVNFELTPELALKLGQAFGSTLRAGQTVMTSRDENPASRMMNRCIISGLLSVGVNVQDLRSIPLPVARYTVRDGANGGVHTRISPQDEASLLIEFFDEVGINVSTVAERKIEGCFFREDFRRTTGDEVGNLDFPARTIEGYSTGFLAALKPKAVGKAGFRIVIDYAYGNSAIILPRLLGALNVDMIALNAYFDPKKARRLADERMHHLGEISDIVRTLGSSFGLLLDNDGETFALVDDMGQIVEGTRLLALLTMLIARNKPRARIAMPIMTPTAIEEIARAHGAEIIHMRSDRRSLRTLDESFDFVGGANDEVLFPEFQPAFDGLYGAAKAMELIAAENRPLSELVNLLPTWHLARNSVACPWDQKGAVMRTLYDELESNDLDLTDGLRVQREEGWVLVLPDASEASVNLYAEGTSEASADRYLMEMQERIQTLVSG